MGKTKYFTTRRTTTTTTTRRSRGPVKRDAIWDLHEYYHSSSVDRHGLTVTGKFKVSSAATQILNSSTVDRSCNGSLDHGRALLKRCRCKIRNLSLDSKKRSQRDMRVDGAKRHFRPYHVTWMAKNGGKMPPGGFDCLDYIHRCHNNNCCEPRHGYWGTSKQNKLTDHCRSGSHVIRIAADGKKSVLRLCPHRPMCLVPIVVTEADFKPIK